MSASVLSAGACGGPGEASPVPTQTTSAQDAAATASARARVTEDCPADAGVPSPLPEEVDPGDAAWVGLTVQELAQQRYEGNRAGALDRWLKCTFPDAYAQLRVEYEPQFHAVVSLTEAAGEDPLAGGPVGVLADRVEVRRVPFSQVQMLVLGERVHDALDSCGLPPVSSSVEVDAVRLHSPDPAVVEECLNTAGARGDLGREPGRDQVEVTEGSDSATVTQTG